MTEMPPLPFPDGELVLRGHLFIHHSLYTTETTKIAELYECHEEEHAQPQWITHSHVHTAPAPEPEWSWDL